MSPGAAQAFDTYSFPRGIVSVGDSSAMLMQKSGGEPGRIVTLQNRYGAAVAERWSYYLRDRQVNFTISGRRVTRGQEIR